MRARADVRGRQHPGLGHSLNSCILVVWKFFLLCHSTNPHPYGTLLLTAQGCCCTVWIVHGSRGEKLSLQFLWEERFYFQGLADFLGDNTGCIPVRPQTLGLHPTVVLNVSFVRHITHFGWSFPTKGERQEGEAGFALLPCPQAVRPPWWDPWGYSHGRAGGGIQGVAVTCSSLYASIQTAFPGMSRERAVGLRRDPVSAVTPHTSGFQRFPTCPFPVCCAKETAA